MSENRRTILLLGGSQAQVVAIDKARELGYKTVLCDYLPDNPGQFHADVFYLVSTIDREAVLEVALKEHVDGVLAYASEPASPTAAYVAQELKLPGNPLEAVEIMGSKALFREHMRTHGLPCPGSVAVEAGCSADKVLELLADLHYPLVVKPTDSSGSRGVSVIEGEHGLEEALEYAASYSRGGHLIVEEYISAGFPHVIGGDIFVLDGEVQFWGLMSCLRDSRSTLVPCGEMAPTGLDSEARERVRRVLSALVSSLGIRFGELNVEIIIDKIDTPYVIELASRAGGNMIPIELSDISGLDLIAANIQCAMGEYPGSLSYDTSVASPHATYVLHSEEDGFFNGLEFSDLATRSLYRDCLYVKKGDQVERFTGAERSLGILFHRFETEGEMHAFSEHHEQHVKVMVVQA